MEQKKEYKRPETQEVEMKYEAPLMSEMSGSGDSNEG